MSTRKSFCLVALAFLVAGLIGEYLLQANMFAILWHVRHGFHREINGISFQVPLLYQEHTGSALNQYSFCAWASPIHRESACMEVDFRKLPSDKPFQPMGIALQQALGVSLESQKQATFAGHTGTCMEYRLNDLRISPARPGVGRMWIDCRFADDLRSLFDGSATTAPQFYAFMKNAKPISTGK